MNKTVLVTGIGGNVGQGILRNILACKYELRLVGTNTESVSAGNHLCDAVYKVPYAVEAEYVPAMKQICAREHVDFVIPSTDAESYYLAFAAHELPPLSTSSADVSLVFYNKLKTWEAFHAAGLPFAHTMLPSAYKKNFSSNVVKPITGRGSRDIHMNPPHPEEYSDDYVVQELHHGKEITTAFYVTKDKQLLGQITFERILQNGLTQQAEVTMAYDKKLETIIRGMMQVFDIRGSCNIQSIVEESTGDIVPFEVNGRISGTNSIRSQFGFDDVRYTIDEYVLGKSPVTPKVKPGAAVRIVMDIIYPNRKLADITNNRDEYHLF